MHPTQVPLAEQKVRAGSFKLAHWAGVVQAVHAPPAQIGAAAGQVALVKHCTHLLVVASQSGVPPEQVELSVHCTHAPVVAHDARAGSAKVVHWALAPQATHVPALEQIGVANAQVALVRHCGVGPSGSLVVSMLPVSALLVSMPILVSAPLSTAVPLSTYFSQPGYRAVPSQTQTRFVVSHFSPAAKDVQSRSVVQGTRPPS